jgi:hypothetical protein
MCILDNYWLGVGRSWLALSGCFLLFISLLCPVVDECSQILDCAV